MALPVRELHAAVVRDGAGDHEALSVLRIQEPREAGDRAVTWDGEADFCPCGVTLMGDPDESDGLCGVCAGAPHPGRSADDPGCTCDECDAYWRRIARESALAAARFNRQLVCTCGWTGAYIEHHHDRGEGCVVSKREDAEQ